MKKVLLIVVILFIGFSIAGFTHLGLVKEQIVSPRNYTLSDSIQNIIKTGTQGMTEVSIAKYCVELTSEILDFSEHNDLNNNKANCVGYATVCKSICDYAYKVNNMNITVNHVRGYVTNDYNINLCKLLQNIVPTKYKNFVNNKDLEELCLSEKIICLQYTLENFKVSKEQIMILIESLGGNND